MLRFYVPAAAALVLIASLTFWESVYSDRFAGSSVSAEEFGERFKTLPMRIGDWDGVDMKEEEKTLKMAGAVRHVVDEGVERPRPQQFRGICAERPGHCRQCCRHRLRFGRLADQVAD
ncbi:MAG TPA: hypothetical protein PKC18_10955, partial [Lacipirellulaceae bacterium]|nr:hypothetical protein [Lacipirellulaceae bacterium]